MVGKVKKKEPEYIDKSKKLLAEPKKFLLSLEKYDKDNIPADLIVKMGPYLDDPKFVPELIRFSSKAADAICKWCRAICKYENVAKEIAPKRQAFGEAKAKLNIVTAQLAE